METSKYKTRITLANYLQGFLMLTFSIWLTYPAMQEGRYSGVILLVIISFTVWYFTNLFPIYQVDRLRLRGRTINGKIDIEISNIRKIETHTHLLGLAIFMPIQKGLQVHYGTHKDFFVNPENQADFIQQLLDIHPNIEVMVKDKKRGVVVP